MKLEKINGKYVKKRLTAESRVSIAIWVPILASLFAFVGWISFSTMLLNTSAHPEEYPIRKHSYKVIAVGDIACSADEKNFNDGFGIPDACQQKAVAEAIEKEHADVVLLLGDIQYPTGSRDDYNRSFVPYWRDITAPIYVAAGNHDYGNGARQPALDGYKQSFDTFFPQAVYQKEGKTYFDANIGPWKLYVLDSNCSYVGGCGKGSAQYDWLTSKVINDGGKCSISMWHHPVYSSGIHGTAPDTTYGSEFWRVLAQNSNDIVLNGHDHHYERFSPIDAEGKVTESGMREFISGAGGYSLRKIVSQKTGSEEYIDSQFGYLVLELLPGYYNWEFKNIGGGIRDKGVDYCR